MELSPPVAARGTSTLADCATKRVESTPSSPRDQPDFAHVDRAVAHRLNPMVGMFGAAETMQSMATLIRGLGYVVSDKDDVDNLSEHFYLLTNTIAAALEWEAAVHQGKR